MSDEITEEQRLVSVLGQVLGQKYRDISYWREGGTRLLFRAKWGPAGEDRVIKVDKGDTHALSPRARRHVERGCTTANDIETLADIPDAEKNGLMRLLDYADLTTFGYDGQV